MAPPVSHAAKPPAPVLASSDDSLLAPSESDERIMLRILRFLLDAHSPETVLRRAATALGLLPEVAWADLRHGALSSPASFVLALGPGSTQVLVQLHDDRDGAGRSRVQSLLALVRQVHTREVSLQKLSEEAHTDPLTRLYNRRGFEPLVDQALARAARSGEDIALLVCDVDHFKSLNDRHGHHAGDGALVTVADAIRQVIRPTDVAARLGGDELAILLSGADATGALVVAERLRQAVHTANVMADRNLTLSIGVADTRAVGMAHRPREVLLRCADEALYAAKHAGRNQAACHPACFAPQPLLDTEPTEPILLEQSA